MCDLLCMGQWQNFNATKIPMCLNVSQVNKTRKLSLSFFTLTLVIDVTPPTNAEGKNKKFYSQGLIPTTIIWYSMTYRPNRHAYFLPRSTSADQTASQNQLQPIR